MKILEICLSSGYGGLELYMVKVARHLADHNHDVQIIVRQDSFLDHRLAEQKLDRHYLKSWFYHFPLVAALRLARFIRKNQIDLVHMHHGKDLFPLILFEIFSPAGFTHG